MPVKDMLKKISRKVLGPVTDEIAIVGLQDRFSTYPSQGLTPGKLANLLREADGGDVYRQMELFEEILEKDGHLQSIFQTRRLAVSGKNYSIVPASEDKKDLEIADAVDKMIKRIRGWKNIVNDVLDCVPKGFSACELFWTIHDGNYMVERIRWRHQKKFRFGKIADIKSDPEELRLIIEPNQIERVRGIIPESELMAAATDGVSLMVDPKIRQRFIIAFCHARSGHPARTSLLRTLTYLYLFKNYDVKWWVQFAEILLGYRVGKYDTSQPDQKVLLEKALAGLATDASAVISKDASIEFVEMAQKASTHEVYRDLADWCNGEMSKVVLGHVGSTEGTPGKLGQEDMAKDVKQDLVEADASVVDEVISDDLIRPFVDYNFGPQEEYPYYHTDVEAEENLKDTAEIVQSYQKIGGKVSRKWAKEKFGIPPPDPQDKDDDALEPMAPASPFLPASDLIAADGKKKLLTKR